MPNHSSSITNTSSLNEQKLLKIYHTILQNKFYILESKEHGIEPLLSSLTQIRRWVEEYLSKKSSSKNYLTLSSKVVHKKLIDVNELINNNIGLLIEINNIIMHSPKYYKDDSSAAKTLLKIDYWLNTFKDISNMNNINNTYLAKKKELNKQLIKETNDLNSLKKLGQDDQFDKTLNKKRTPPIENKIKNINKEIKKLNEKHYEYFKHR